MNEQAQTVYSLTVEYFCSNEHKKICYLRSYTHQNWTAKINIFWNSASFFLNFLIVWPILIFTYINLKFIYVEKLRQPIFPLAYIPDCQQLHLLTFCQQLCLLTFPISNRAITYKQLLYTF